MIMKKRASTRETGISLLIAYFVFAKTVICGVLAQSRMVISCTLKNCYFEILI